MKIKIMSVLVLLFIMGCSPKSTDPLRLSVNLWIGYSPLFYLEQKGWLKEHNIKMVNVVSLSENKQMYISGFADAFSGTQYEFKEVKKQFPTLEPLILMDRSNGGDVVMANRDIETLKVTPKIDVYMEIDSVSKAVFDDFIAYHGLKRSTMYLNNKDPYASSNLPMIDSPTMIVTYDPYDTRLQKSGYKSIDTTKNLQLFVMDALYTDEQTMKKYAHELKQLNKLIGKALDELKKDPKAYYAVINPFFKYKNYEEFLHALDGITWIYNDRSDLILKELSDHNISSTQLLEPIYEF